MLSTRMTTTTTRRMRQGGPTQVAITAKAQQQKARANPLHSSCLSPLSTSGRTRTTKVTREVGAFAQAEAVQAQSSDDDALSPPMRIGHGFDLHRLEPGYKLIIGGLDIPHDRGGVAHSDGDVLLHCVTDAVLGALCLEDIGQIFPDNDPKWKGAASDIFMNEAMRLCDEMGYRVSNLDATIIAQRPKLSPHKEIIRDNVATLLKCDRRLVNIKAKTHEKVDSLGENRSIGCHCVVLLVKK